jgi:parallel beta-helix repeat protein
MMRKRRLWYLGLLSVAVLAVLPFLLAAGAGAALAVSKPPPPTKPPAKPVPGAAPIATSAFVCGEVAMASVTLTADENCPGSTAIFIGKAGVIVNLNGHTLSSDGTGGTYGVYDSGFSGVTVTNGVVDDFAAGVVLIANSSHATTLRVENNLSQGIFAAGNTDGISNNYALTNGSAGIVVDGGSSDQVTGNWAESNTGIGIFMLGVTGGVVSNNKTLNNSGGSGYGIVAVSGTGTVTGNVANGNSVDGIDLGGSGTGVTSGLTASTNRAAFNGGFGINSTAGGVDGGGNVVQDNTNPAQCLNIVCHEVAT